MEHEQASDDPALHLPVQRPPDAASVMAGAEAPTEGTEAEAEIMMKIRFASQLAGGFLEHAAVWERLEVSFD